MVVFIDFTIAQPTPFQVSDTTTGSLTIIFPKNPYFLQGQPIDLHFHIHNSTGAFMQPDVDINFCTIHIYNSSNNHLYRANMSNDGVEYEVELDSSFTEDNIAYPYMVWCDGVSEDGYASGEYLVSKSLQTTEGNQGQGMVAVTIIYAIIITMLTYLANNWRYAILKGRENKTNIIQLFLVWLVLLTFPLALQAAVELAEVANLNSDIITLTETAYGVSIWIFFVISVYFIVMFIYELLWRLSKTKYEK